MINNDIPNTTLKTKYWTIQTVICILYSFYIIFTTTRYCWNTATADVTHQSFNKAFLPFNSFRPKWLIVKRFIITVVT
jgi:hypothetical protein